MRLIFLMCLAVFFTACDPCASTICDNGSCENGNCICNEGYFKNGADCAPINLLYIGPGTVTATQLYVDNQGNSSNLPDVQLSLSAVVNDVYSFTLLSFNNQIKNDIVFTISSVNNDVISTTNNPQTTSAGNTYTISGGRVGNQISLQIQDASGNTYTLQYVA